MYIAQYCYNPECKSFEKEVQAFKIDHLRRCPDCKKPTNITKEDLESMGGRY